jgi:putative flavoprotein involved in K+ transport
MKHTDSIIIGGGQAGLAMSHCLGERGIDHVVLERGRVGERWRSERWDSLKLLTPNWQSRLPGFRYRGDDPNGFMSMPQVIDYLERYAQSFSAPVHSGTTVMSVVRSDGGYRVTTDRGVWCAPNVVIATGYAAKPNVPAMAAKLSGSVHQVVPTRYKRPDQLPDGGVLVVGASATGVQLADELHRSGRPVTLAVGRHIRMPRRYRGHDTMQWLDRLGILDESIDDVGDLERSRSQPSLQLVGRDDNSSLDLQTLQQQGVRLVGAATAIDGQQVHFDGSLRQTISHADQKLTRILDRIDAFADASGMGSAAGRRPDAIACGRGPQSLDLKAAGISSVLWATGYKRTYPWLKMPVTDARGELIHRGGITPADGLYALGLMFQRRRKSNYIDGVGDDAEELAQHIENRMAGPQSRAAA